MARNLAAGMLTEITGPQFTPVLFLKMEFDSADTNLWTGLGPITFNGDSYVAVGGILSISAVNESLALRADAVTVQLTGVPSANIALALTQNYSERFAHVWLGALDANEDLVSSPNLIYTGRMDVMQIKLSGDESVITLTIVNRLVDLERPKDRYYTDEDQQEQFPGDRGLEFVSSLNDGRQVIWGQQ